jgi:hypothetical protein
MKGIEEMKRDLDLIRQLLMVVENSEAATLNPSYGLTPGDQRVQYHLRLLVDAGLVRGVGLTGEGSVCVRLTWDGHELLELIRNEQLWERAKRLVSEKTGGSAVEAIRAVLRKWTEMSVADEDRWPVRLPHQVHAGRVTTPATSGSHNGNGNGNGGTSLTGTGTTSRWPATRKPIEEVVRTTPVVSNRATTATEADNDATFQFSVWTGHDTERKPVYLL